MNAEVATVFLLDAEAEPAAHKLLGLADGVGNVEVFVDITIRLLSVTTLLMIPTLT